MAWGKNKVRELRGERRVARNLADGEKERIVGERCYHLREVFFCLFVLF